MSEHDSNVFPFPSSRKYGRPKFSPVGYAHETQSDVWNWLLDFSQMRGVSWTTISKEICEINGVEWSKQFYWAIENWASLRGLIGKDEFEWVYSYSNIKINEVRSYLHSNLNSHDIFKMIEDRFSDITIEETGDILRKQNSIVIGNKKQKLLSYSGVWFGKIGENAELDCFLLVDEVAGSRAMRLKLCSLYNGRIVHPRYSGVLSPCRSGSLMLYAWDMETYDCHMRKYWSLFGASKITKGRKVKNDRFAKVLESIEQYEKDCQLPQKLTKIFDVDITKRGIGRDFHLNTISDYNAEDYPSFERAIKELTSFSWRIVE